MTTTTAEAIRDLSREIARLDRRERKLKTKQKRTARSLRDLRTRRERLREQLAEQERAGAAAADAAKRADLKEQLACLLGAAPVRITRGRGRP